MVESIMFLTSKENLHVLVTAPLYQVKLPTYIFLKVQKLFKFCRIPFYRDMLQV